MSQKATGRLHAQAAKKRREKEAALKVARKARRVELQQSRDKKK